MPCLAYCSISRRGHRGTGYHNAVHVGQISGEDTRHSGERRQHGGHREERVHPVVDEISEETDGLEAAADDHGAAANDRAQSQSVESADVEQRGDGEGGITAASAEAGVDVDTVPPDIAVGEDHAFGLSGRPGGEHEDGRIVKPPVRRREPHRLDLQGRRSARPVL